MILDYIVSGRNILKIAASTAGVAGLIIMRIAGLGGGATPAYQVQAPSGSNYWMVTDRGGMGVGTGASMYGNSGDCLKSNGSSGSMLSWGSCSTTTFTAGRGLGLSSGVFTLNATITGSLVNFATHSGYTLFAKNTLASSGALKVLGNMSGASLNVNNLLSCANLKTSAAGAVSCNSTNYITSAAQGLSVVSTNSLRLNATITGSLVSFQTVSGSALYAKNTLSSSGGLKVLGNISGATLNVNNLLSCTNLQTNSAGRLACNTSSYLTTTLADDSAFVGNSSNIATATALPSCSNGSSQALEYNTSTNAFSCVTITGTTYTAGRGLGLASNVFTLNSTITGSLVQFGTFSGNTVFAKNTLNTSGALKVLGRMSGATLTVNNQASVSGALVVRGNIRGQNTINSVGLLSGDNLTIMGASSYILGPLSIGKTGAPRGKVEVMGTVSGAIVLGSVVSGTTLRYGTGGISPIIRGVEVVSSGSTVAIGSGKALIPAPGRFASGYKVIDAYATTMIAGTTNSTTLQVRNLSKGGRKIFSTPVTIDSATTDSKASTTKVVVNATNADCGAYDTLVVDIPATSTTVPKVLQLFLILAKP